MKHNAMLDHMREELNKFHEIWAIKISRCAALIVSNLNHDLNVENEDREQDIPRAAVLQDVLEAAKDLADYLDGTRIPPELNRNGIPHARSWDLGHAMHMVRDLTYSLDETQSSLPELLYAKTIRALLDLAIDIALASSYEEAIPFLDNMVQGNTAQPE